MTEPVTDNAFIVISGHHPQAGKRERISKVRAHITKRYFRRIHQRAEGEQTRAPPWLALPNDILQGPEQRNASYPIIPLYPSPVNNYALLDSASFSIETTRRMHRFFDIHLRGNIDSHPFYVNVFRWSISDPYFMSAKLLNASGWDDILESGDLSLWTTRQRFIAIRLLNDALDNNAAAKDRQAMVATVQSLLSFELLMGNNESIDRLQNFYHSVVIFQSNQPNDEVWAVLSRCHYILSYADRLRRAANNDNTYNHTSSSFILIDSHPHPDYQFIFPFDFALFTLGQAGLNENYNLDYTVLSNLYHILSMATSSQVSPPNRSTYEYLLSQHERLRSHITDQDTISANNPRIAPVCLSTFILTSSLLAPHNNLPALASQLRTLLGSTTNGPHKYAHWTPFLGALIWCHAIGLRFADARRDRTWFLMQFLRAAQLGMLERWEETGRSTSAVVGGLERIGELLDLLRVLVLESISLQHFYA
ncbi:hypothetical protein B7494_g3881 [Chlorociboria aeruginascens]|nr:hypothetical protein B7494_g3881 [Chlorociboria aeruginascens]